MTLNIRNKRSAVQGSAPTASQLQDGELAVNYNASDPVIYTKDTAGNVIRLTGAGADGNFRRVGTTLSPTTLGDVVNVGAGTAAAPSLHFSDANSGLYRPGTNQVAIATGGTQRVLFDSNGNVGIGRTPGAFKLDVNGTTRILSSGQSSLLEIGAGTTSNQAALIDLVGDTTYADYGLRIIRSNGGANASSFLQHRGTGAFVFRTVEAAALKFDMNNLERMRVHTNGNVGIGTSSPVRILHIADAQPIIRLEDSDGTNQYGEVFKAGSGLYLDSRDNTANGPIIFRGNGSGNEYARFDVNGNFGLGATSPATDIHIANTIPTIRLQDSDGTNQYSQILESDGSLYLDSRNNTSNGQIIFRGDSGTAQEYARFDADGNFGLGTTSPVRNLHITSTSPSLRLEDSDSGTANTYGEFTYSTNAVYLDSRNGTSNAPIVFRGDNGTTFTEYGRFTSSGEFRTTGSANISGIQYPTAGALSNRNLIINGAMQVAQRATQVLTVTAGGYSTCDRWRFNLLTLGTWTVDQATDAPEGFTKSFKATCTTADASPAAADTALINQRIEAQNLQHLKYGTSNAGNLIVSFWVKSNKTGDASIDLIQRNNSDRQFTTSYTINSANTWEYKTITIPGDPSGLINDDNGSGLQLGWWLNSGSNFTTGTHSAAWEAVDNTNRNATNLGVGGATNDYLAITGVQLEIGTAATPFEHRSYGQELALCQRYYEEVPVAARVTTPTGAFMNTPGIYKVTKRAAPTITAKYLTASNGITSETAAQITESGFRYEIGTTANADTYTIGRIYAVNAEL